MAVGEILILIGLSWLHAADVKIWVGEGKLVETRLRLYRDFRV